MNANNPKDISTIEKLMDLCEEKWPDHNWLVRSGPSEESGYFASIGPKDFIGNLSPDEHMTRSKGSTPFQALYNAFIEKSMKEMRL